MHKLTDKMNSGNNIVSEIELLCQIKGTNLNQVCQTAGIDRSVLVRWKQNEPKTISTLRSILSVLGVSTEDGLIDRRRSSRK